MTYYELFTKAENLLIKNKISLVEYDEMVQPLNEEVRKEGRWIDNGDRYYRCSLCGMKDTDNWKFCRGCGAYMKGEANDIR